MVRRLTNKISLRRFIKQTRKEIDRRIAHERGDDDDLEDIDTDDARYNFICGNDKLRAWADKYNVELPEKVEA